MTVSLQNLRAVGVGVEPSSLLPGQIAFNVTDKVIYVGDGSSLKTNFDGTTTGGSPGGGWFAMPMDYSFLNTYFLTNPELYGDFPTDGQVVTWSTPLSRPIWTSNGGGGSNQVYQTTNAAVASATGATLSDKISAAIGVVSPDEGNVTVVTGVSGDVYQGLYFFITSWVRGAYFAYPTASNVPYSNILSGLSAITVQQAIDEVDGLVNIAQSTANTAAADAAAAGVIATAALPKAGGTMTGAISFVAGQTFPVSGIQDSTALQKGVVQGGSNMTYTSPGVMDVRAASISQSGVVTLSDSTNLTSSTVAATSTAAKNLQDQIDAISLASNVTLAGTLDAASGLVTSVTTQGTAAGFVSGSPLPAAALGNADYYVIVDNDGSYNPPGGGGPYTAEVGDWFLSDGTTWQFLGVGNRPAYATTSSAGIIQLSDNPTTQAGLNALLAVTPSSLQSKLSDSVALTSSNFISSSTAVKTAYDRGATAETNSIPKITVAAKGTIVTGSAANTPAGLPVGTNNQILIANPSTATGLQWAGDITGFVTGVSGTAPITVNNLNPQTPIVGISAASTLASGAVQLEDSTSSTSTSLALTANQGYSLQQQINALIVSNNLTLAGTIDGSTGVMVTVTAEGTLNGFTVGAVMPAPVAGNSEYFTIVTVPGTMTPPGGSAQAVNDGDWWLSNGTVWQYLPIGYSAPYATTTSSGVVQLATDAEVQAGVETTHAVVPSALQSKLSDSISTTSSTTIASSTAVKSAYDLANAAIAKSIVTAKGDLIVATASATVAALPTGTNGQSLVVDTACATGLKWGQSLDGYTCSATPFNTALGAGAGDSITTGTNGVFIGHCAGTSVQTGINVIAIGFCALDVTTAGTNAIAIGSGALGATTGGTNNIAIGASTMGSGSAGANNVAVGGGALQSVSGQQNVAVGHLAGSGATSGSNNTLIGYQAGNSISTGANNTIIGRVLGTAGLSNNLILAAGTTVKFQANANGAWSPDGTNFGTIGQFLASNGTVAAPTWCTLSLACVPCAAFTAVGDILVGTGSATFTALPVGTNGQSLVVDTACATGLKWGAALEGFTTADNTAMGVGSLLALTTGVDNTAIGVNTGTGVTAGSRNVLIGDGSGDGLTAGNNNTAVGYNSFSGTGGQNNTVMGYQAGLTLTVGNSNTVIGASAGDALTGANSVVVVGQGALSGGATATGTVAIGQASLGLLTSGASNTAVGYQSGDRVTTGSENTLFGFNAGGALTTGGQNILIGSQAGDLITTGSGNTVIGDVAGAAGLTNNLILAADTTVKFQANDNGAWSPDGINYGTAGQTLQSNGTAAVPTWVTPQTISTTATKAVTSATPVNLLSWASGVRMGDLTVMATDNSTNVVWANTTIASSSGIGSSVVVSQAGTFGTFAVIAGGSGETIVEFTPSSTLATVNFVYKYTVSFGTQPTVL